MSNKISFSDLRIAEITKLIKYNKTGLAADVNWGWKEVMREELQFKNEDGVWEPITIVKIRDESDKEKEESSRKNKLKLYLDETKSILDEIKLHDNPSTYWKIIDERRFFYFLDYIDAVSVESPDEDGFIIYFGRRGDQKPVAKAKQSQYFCRGDLLLQWLEPNTLNWISV